ncbi:hypothetical protein HONESTABE_92 [Bacillus phage HonestAbe]|uniref:virion structural protein n=1 Tax=Bacillus phage Zuko TaxID=1805956 RepID=UPI0007A770F3|nr:virion structural protein [Bacillus phage Zuko]AMW62379.1 hypothetical protein ZUKO_94 [Bacillus phage Zuko]AUV57729.1 hypothetical protein HONESTABE_92 [Bacillus phage HonestAbe]
MAEKPIMLQQIAQATNRLPDLDQHIDTFSQKVLWEKSFLCPCKDKDTAQPDPTCRICHGRGISFRPPVQMTMMVQSQAKGAINDDLGISDTGTAIGTPDRSQRIAFRDRITVPNAKLSQSILFDVTDKRIKHGLYLVYDVQSVDLAMSIDGEIFEGTHFRIDYKTNRIYPDASMLGKNISLNVLTTLRYLVADLLKEHRYARDMDFSQHNTYQKLLLKREDLFIDKEAFSQGISNEVAREQLDSKRPLNPNGMNGFFGNLG